MAGATAIIPFPSEVSAVCPLYAAQDARSFVGARGGSYGQLTNPGSVGSLLLLRKGKGRKTDL